jgi:hypothetical protein
MGWAVADVADRGGGHGSSTTLVRGALILIGVAGGRSVSGRAGTPELAIAGAILTAGVLIASAIPPPPRPPRPKPPHPLD